MKKTKSTHKTIISNLIIHFIYLSVLDIIYINTISPLYKYAGFTNDLRSDKIIISFLLLALIVILLPNKNKSVSQTVLKLHFIVIIIPLLSIYSMVNLSTVFTLMVVSCFILQIILIKFLPNFQIKTIKNGKYFTVFILGVLSLMTYLYLFTTQRINISALDFSVIYEIRSSRKINSFMAYLITWQFRIINPVLMVLTYMRKKYLLMSAIITLQILTYLMYPNKEIILSIILIASTIAIYEKRKEFIKPFILFLLFGMLISISIYEYYEDITLLSIIPFRLLNVPALMKFEHFEFFSNNEKLFYSEGLIGKVLGIKYKYSVPSGMLIQDGMWGNANTGYIAYAFSNAGYGGMIVMSLLLVFVLKYIDSLVIKYNKGIIFSLLVYPMLILNDGDLLTLLLSGGLFLLFLIFATFEFKKIEN